MRLHGPNPRRSSPRRNSWTPPSHPARQPVVLDVRYPGIGLPDDGYDQYLAGHLCPGGLRRLDDALAAPTRPGIWTPPATRSLSSGRHAGRRE